jgi:hypothetical protein
MVEFFLVQVDHIGVAPFVVRVAIAASGGFQPTMEASFRPHIVTDVFVAGHAQAVLRFAVKFDVALLALVFHLCVALYDFPWRHDGLNSLR